MKRFINLKKDKEPLSYEEKYLLEEIASTKIAIDVAYSNFENAIEPDLIDCYIYQLNSEQKRYKYLIERAKEVQFKSELFC
ncbi:YaaL family protein [[Clostridium] fimetarium]|uniref:DUF2508 domain-containing protein n=1 Tax=[Clostridium] fimetarium TaxID=99656 RepID=A0A1I0RE83_9FIRM|nr:YaaL family protein [[Clostridium] fimetarium]SEW39063.1 Protein of unknown function [[Clostridium] fimetarium]